MSFGSFCAKKDDSKDLQILQPEFLSIEGKQVGFLSYLNIIQSIENKTGKNLEEIMYIFPTDNRLCLYGLTFFIGEEKIEAKIEKNDHSKEIFEEAKTTGKTAVISKNISPGLTSICIGNVPKNETIKVILKCSLMSQLSSPNKIITKIPLHGCDIKGDFLDLADLPSLNLNVDIDIIQFSEIRKVDVNLDDFTFDTKQNKIIVKSAAVTSDNFIIEIEFSEKVQSQMVKCEKVTTLSIIPEFDSKQKTNEKKEFVFLVDCSASMIGDSIEKAKKSINLFISHLPENSKFNIIQFGTSYKKMFDEPVDSNQANKNAAKKKVSKIMANLGGTEMLQLFEELFEKLPFNQREIFLITDGEVYKREEVVKLIEKNKDFNRIFAIGLGNGADAGFLDEIAEITNGKSDFVYDSEELPNKISEHLELSLVPSATNTEIHIEGEKEIQISPYPLPPLLQGVVHHFFVRYSDNSEGKNNVLITASIPGHDENEEFEFVINDECIENLIIDENEKNPILSLFAHKQLKNLEKNNEEMATQLSLESGVLCKYTSYIGVSSLSYVQLEDNGNRRNYERSMSVGCSKISDDRIMEIKRNLDEACGMMKINLSIALSRGESLASLSYSSAMECCAAMPKCKPSSKKPSFMSKVKNFFGHFGFGGNKKKEEEDNDDKDKDDDDECSGDKKLYECPSEEKSSESTEKYYTDETEKQTHLNNLSFDLNHAWKNNASIDDIVKLQSRDGFWDISTKFITKHFLNESEIPRIGSSFGNAIIEKRVRSTVFVLAFLSKYHIENYGGNSQLKALKWLNKIKKTVNWELIISVFKENIQTQNINLENN